MLYAGDRYGALHDGILKAGLTLPLGGGFSLQPLIQAYIPLSSQAQRVVDGRPFKPNGPVKTSVVFGLNGVLSF